MANTIKSKLKRLGSKRRSDADTSTDTTDSQTESIKSNRNSTLSGPPLIPAPTAPRKSVDTSLSRESTNVAGIVQLKTPGAGPKSDSESRESSAGLAHDSPAVAAAKASSPKKPEEKPEEPEPKKPLEIAEKKLPVVSQSAPESKPIKKPEVEAPQQENVSAPPEPSNARSDTPEVDEAPLEIKTVNNKQYVFHQSSKGLGASSTLPVHQPVSARHSPIPSPLGSRSASPVPSPRPPRHATFLVDSKHSHGHGHGHAHGHGHSHSISGKPLSRSSSRVALNRTPSMAQVARDNKSHLSNDTRHFYQGGHVGGGTSHADTRPSLSRKSSYADDKRALEYIANKNSEHSAENSNLMFRTSSRIWDANKESDMWFSYESRSRISSRRESVASSTSDSDEDENLHPGRFISRSGSFASDDGEAPEFADSIIIRAADWLLGIPHDSPQTLRNSLKRKPKPMSLLEKRRLREANVASDPAFLLAAFLSLREAMS